MLLLCADIYMKAGGGSLISITNLHSQLPHYYSPPGLYIGPHNCHLCNTRGNKYTYMEDLQALNSCCTSGPPHPAISRITTPLRTEEWAACLQSHPDQAFVSYILQGIHEGFRVGFSRASRCRSVVRNLRSAQEHPDVVDSYLRKEVALGRLIRFAKSTVPVLPELTTSPIGVIPKRS